MPRRCNIQWCNKRLLQRLGLVWFRSDSRLLPSTVTKTKILYRRFELTNTSSESWMSHFSESHFYPQFEYTSQMLGPIYQRHKAVRLLSGRFLPTPRVTRGQNIHHVNLVNRLKHSHLLTVCWITLLIFKLFWLIVVEKGIQIKTCKNRRMEETCTSIALF